MSIQGASSDCTLPQIGTGPVRRGVTSIVREDPRSPRCRPGDVLDVLLDDGRIVRGRVSRPMFCGRLGVEDIPGPVHVSRVRNPGCWTGEKGCSYLEGVFAQEVPEAPRKPQWGFKR